MAQGDQKKKTKRIAAAKGRPLQRKGNKKHGTSNPVIKKKMKKPLAKNLESGFRSCIEKELTSKAQQDGYKFKFSEGPSSKKSSRKSSSTAQGPSTSK